MQHNPETNPAASLMNQVRLASAIHFPGRRKIGKGGVGRGGGGSGCMEGEGKPKNSAANAPSLHSASAWASPPPAGGRAAPAAAGSPGFPARSTPSRSRRRALSLLGLCSESGFQRTAARTRHLPPGFSRGLAGWRGRG